MKHVSGVFYHNVIVVSVADAEYIRGNAVGCTRLGEIDHGFAEIIRTWIVSLEPIVYAIFFERFHYFSLLNFF